MLCHYNVLVTSTLPYVFRFNGDCHVCDLSYVVVGEVNRESIKLAPFPTLTNGVSM